MTDVIRIHAWAIILIALSMFVAGITMISQKMWWIFILSLLCVAFSVYFGIKGVNEK